MNSTYISTNELLPAPTLAPSKNNVIDYYQDTAGDGVSLTIKPYKGIAKGQQIRSWVIGDGTLYAPLTVDDINKNYIHKVPAPLFRKDKVQVKFEVYEGQELLFVSKTGEYTVVGYLP